MSKRGRASARRHGAFACQARSWPHERRVVVKAEVTAHPGRQPKDNPRFVVTNLKTTPQHVCERVHCARGDAENRLKELKQGLEIDRTSCTRFLASQFRVLMTAAACVPMQELRLKARRTSCARAQVGTLRLRLPKLGAWIETSVRRIVVHLPVGTPVRRRLAPHCALGRRGRDLTRPDRFAGLPHGSADPRPHSPRIRQCRRGTPRNVHRPAGNTPIASQSPHFRRMSLRATAFEPQHPTFMNNPG